MIAEFALAVVLTSSSPDEHDHNLAVVPTCLLEDGSGQDVCYWDAQEAGNQDGFSFLMLQVSPDVRTYTYTDGHVERVYIR